MTRGIHFKLLGALAAVLLFAATASAQTWNGKGRAHGRVTDAETNKPMQGVKITILKDGVEGAGPEPIMTDKKGRWVFGGLRNGNWKVLFDYDGYTPRSASFKVSELGTTRPLNLAMTPIISSQEREAMGQRRSRLEEAGDFFAAGQWAEARAAYEEVLTEIKDDESKRQLREGIAQTYYQEGNYAAAREIWQDLLGTLPDDATPAQRLALMQGIARSHYEDKDTDQAIATLQKALEVVPGDVETLKLTINLLVAAGRESEAQTYMAQLPEGATVDADAVLNMGITLYNENDVEGALERFNQAVAENPELADAYYYRGLAYLNKGQNPESLADFKKFLELAPDHPKASEAQSFAEYLGTLD